MTDKEDWELSSEYESTPVNDPPDIEPFKDRLREKGFSDVQVVQVLEIMQDMGIDARIFMSNFYFHAGDAIQINMVDVKNKEPKPDGYIPRFMFGFVAKDSGIDPLRVMSVKLPELNRDKPGHLYADIKLFPFKVKKLEFGNTEGLERPKEYPTVKEE